MPAYSLFACYPFVPRYYGKLEKDIYFLFMMLHATSSHQAELTGNN